MPKAQGPVQNIGAAGERVAENVQRLRGAMSYRELSKRLEELGRPIPVLGLSRIESKARRVDADDLVALAIALEVSPTRLLMPPERIDNEIHLTPERVATWEAAWRWATGGQPLLEVGEELPLGDVRVRRFLEENRPYERQRPVDEAALLLVARELPPFSASIRHDGVRTRATLTYGDDDGER